MLNSYRKGACALAAALTLMGASAHAAEHLVIIVDGGYFPAVTYAGVGDTVVFENESGASHTVSGPEDTWTSGTIQASGSYALTLEEETPLTFYGSDSGGAEVIGEISYSAPPISN